MKRRIFLAIGLPDEITNKIIEAVKRWQWLPIRWTPPVNWHITVIPPFYVDEEELNRIEVAARTTVSDFKPFHISFSSIELAPPGSPARMIWLSGPRLGALQKLKKAIDEKISLHKALSFYKPEPRIIATHITLARFEEGVMKDIESKTKTLEEFKLKFFVNEINIMESHLRPTGAVYDVLSRLPLRTELRNTPAAE